jgi:hypothetical protein
MREEEPYLFDGYYIALYRHEKWKPKIIKLEWWDGNSLPEVWLDEPLLISESENLTIVGETSSFYDTWYIRAGINYLQTENFQDWEAKKWISILSEDKSIFVVSSIIETYIDYKIKLFSDLQLSEVNDLCGWLAELYSEYKEEIMIKDIIE